MIYLRTTLFYLGEGLSAIPFFFIALFALPFPPRKRSKIISIWARFVSWWLKLCCGLDYQLEGQQNIPAEPCVFACNHQSTWESITTQTFLPSIAWVLKKELFRIPFFGWGLWATRPIAIDRSERSTALEQVVFQGQQKLAEGRHVLIFPEGTRMTHGTPGRYKKGAVMLARAANTVIVPIAHDAGKYWSKSSLLIQPGTIRCIIGPAIAIDGKADKEVTEDVKNWITSQGL